MVSDDATTAGNPAQRRPSEVKEVKGWEELGFWAGVVGRIGHLHRVTVQESTSPPAPVRLPPVQGDALVRIQTAARRRLASKRSSQIRRARLKQGLLGTTWLHEQKKAARVRQQQLQDEQAAPAPQPPPVAAAPARPSSKLSTRPSATGPTITFTSNVDDQAAELRRATTGCKHFDGSARAPAPAMRDLARGALVEFLAMTLFVYFGCGSAASNAHFNSGEWDASSVTIIAFQFGLGSTRLDPNPASRCASRSH